MANRFPLIVNSVSKKIEELVSGDNLDLSGNAIVVNGDTGSGKYLTSDGTNVFWDAPGDVYLTLAQTLSNKTLSDCIISGSSNTLSAIPNASLVNSGITINGSTVFLGGSLTVSDSNTTYGLSAVDGATASVKIIKLLGSDSIETSASIGVAIPSSVPSGSNAIDLTIERTDSLIEISGTVVDNNTITTVQSAAGGTAQSGAISISGSGGATITQDTVSKTIDINSRNDNTITQLRGGTGNVYADGDFTILGGTQVTISQANNATSGDPEITINSVDTVTKLRGGTTAAYIPSSTGGTTEITIAGGSGGNVTVGQAGNTIEIDSLNDDTVTRVAAGAESLVAGDFRFVQSGDATVSSAYDAGTGLTTITVGATNTDTGATLGAGTGINLDGSSNFEIKNSNNLIENRVSVWDSTNGQFANGSISDDGTQVTISGDLVVLGTNTILETSTLQVEDNNIELRKGDGLLGSNGGIQLNRTTNSEGVVTSFQRFEWYESGAYWRSYDGSIENRIVTQGETQTLTNKTLTNPIFTTPTLGDATATTYNGLSIISTSASSFDMADQKHLVVNNSLTFSADDSLAPIVVNFDVGGGAGSKVAYNSFHLGQFALTTSTQLSGKIQDKSGSGKLMFDTNPIIVDSIGTSSNAFDLINTSALGINFGGDATAIEIGSTSGTTSINHSLAVDGNVTLGDASTDTLLVNGNPNFDNHDISIRGTDANPIYVGRGGGEVSSNTRVGYSALQSNQSGSQNTAMGYQALITNVAGASNTAYGYNALRDNDGGNNNVAIGKDSQLINQSGTGNVAIGVGSLENNPSSGYNVCIGHFAGNGCTGIGNVVIGPADTEDATSTTFFNTAGDRQLVIGSGTGSWLTGDFSFNTTVQNDLTVNGDARVIGDLRVDGATVSINSTTMTIDDKNIELAAVSNTTINAGVSNGSTTITDINPVSGIIVGMEISSPNGVIPSGTTITFLNPGTKQATLSNAVSSNLANETFVVTGPTDTAADGGGIIIKGTPVLQGGTGNKTLLYDHSRTKKYFVSSENFELASGKEFAIGNQLALSTTTLGSSVVNSSLTSLGTLVGPTGQPALTTDGAAVLGGRVIEEVFSNMATGFSLSSNTLTVTAAAANTICGETTTANQAINTWAFSTADPDGTTLQNGQSLTITLIVDASTASTYGDDCTVDGNNIATGVRWSGGSPPIATSNTDILTFLIIKDSGGVVRVYGQGNTDFS